MLTGDRFLIIVIQLAFFSFFWQPTESYAFSITEFNSLQSRSGHGCLDKGDGLNNVRAKYCKSDDSINGNQTWEFERNSKGFYLIKNIETGKCLDSHFSFNNQRPRMIACNSKYWSSQWDLIEVSNSSLHVVIKNRYTKKCLVSYQVVYESQVRVASCKSSHWNQHWALRGAQIKDHTWDPLMKSDCLVATGPEDLMWYQELPGGLSEDCEVDYHGRPMSAWFVSMTNEHRPFPIPGVPNPPPAERDTNNWDFMDGDFGTLANYSLRPLTSSLKQMGLHLNKRGFPHRNDRFTYYGVTDHFNYNKKSKSIQIPRLKDNIWLDVNMGLYDYVNDRFGNWQGEARGRVVVAASIRSKGKIYFLEINLYRDALMDFCHVNSNPIIPNAVKDPKCDTAYDLFDRRTRHIPKNGATWTESEYIQLNANRIDAVTGYKLPRITLDNRGNKFQFMIPLTQLIKADIWYDKPDLEDATIAGIYMGIEAWGGVRMGIEFDRYRIYSVSE